MKKNLPVIRNTAFGLMLLFFLMLSMSLGPAFYTPCTLFGASGVVVLTLTIMIHEPVVQKLLFSLAGVAGTAAFITLVVFHLLARFGRTPGGDGGGITVAMLLGCPVVFLISCIGVLAYRMACHIRRKGPEKRSTG